MEIKETKVIQADERCPICGNKKDGGWMRPTGIVKQTNPPYFEHVCSACGYKQDYGVRYPYNV